MIYNLLCSIAALSWIWDTSLPSIVLFGEVNAPYPVPFLSFEKLR